jgi:exocyst complex component 4
MLRTSPFHKDNYSRLILTVVIQFYQRCNDRFQDLIVMKDTNVQDAEKRVALAADWAQKADLLPCLSELMRIPVRWLDHNYVLVDKLQDVNSPLKEKLYLQETALQLNLLGKDGKVEKDHLIGSMRNLSTLGSLYTSVVSFVIADLVITDCHLFQVLAYNSVD